MLFCSFRLFYELSDTIYLSLWHFQHPSKSDCSIPSIIFVHLVDRSQIPLACFYFGKIFFKKKKHIALWGRTDRIGGYALSEIKIHLSSPSAFECFYLIILDLHIQLTGPCSFVRFPHFQYFTHSISWCSAGFLRLTGHRFLQLQKIFFCGFSENMSLMQYFFLPKI